VTGNFVLPFRGQGSGKSLPVPCICGTKIKAQGCAENFNSCRCEVGGTGGDAVKAEIHITDCGRKEVAAGLG
jgi:hypothetical protein